MNHIIRKQDGMTFLGFIIVLAVIGAFVLMGLRLFPLYNEKYKVLSVMKSIVNTPDSASLSQAEMYKMFYNNADVQGLRFFETTKAVADHVKLERGDKGEPPSIHVFFEKRNKLFDDIDLVLDFDESMPLSGGGEGGG